MLAALLCNLTDTPPPPAVAPQQFFGGGPFWKRYGYDPRYYRQEETELPEVSEAQAEIVEEAIERAVEAIRTEPKPAPIVLNARRIYERVFRELRGIEQERVREIWRAEVKRRLKELEEEEMIVCLMSL